MQEQDPIGTSEDVNLSELQGEYDRASTQTDGFDRLEYAENIRFTRWPGQSPDGKKWDSRMPEGQRALPWNGCADTRVPLADEVVNEVTAMSVTAFWRAQIRAHPVDHNDATQAAHINRYMDWLRRTRMNRELRREVELCAQYGNSYGWALMYVGWDREIGVRDQEVTLQQLLPLLQSNPEFAPAIEALQDPDREEEAIAYVQSVFAYYLTQAAGLYESELTSLGKVNSRHAVRELRESGVTTIALPYVQRNQPCVTACKPWEEVRLPPETLELQSARAVFWTQWMTEGALLAKAAVEGWDDSWVEKARKVKGQTRVFRSTGSSRRYSSTLTNATKSSANTYRVQDPNSQLIEVVYGFTKKTDKSGRASVWCTVFNPVIGNDLVGKHERLDYAHGNYPFVPFAREYTSRQLTDSRGIPEVVATWQIEEKTQRDMLLNRSHFDTLPPVVVPKLLGVEYRLGPAAQVPEHRAGSIRFLDSPKRGPDTSIALIELLQQRINTYFGLPAENVIPARAQVRAEMNIKNFFLCWSEVFQQIYSLVAQYGDDREFQRVTNSQEPLDRGSAAQTYDFTLSFDARELNPEFLEQKMSAISQILPEDAAGVIDRATLIKIKLQMIDPMMASDLVVDEASASQQVFRSVREQLAQMALGNEAEYVEADPTAGAKLRFASQVFQANPNYQQLIQQDERFAELVKKFADNLTQSVTQEQNKLVGRLGVQPESGSIANITGAVGPQ